MLITPTIEIYKYDLKFLTLYPYLSSLLEMISALSRNSPCEMIQEKESYEFQPLGGKSACAFCRSDKASDNSLKWVIFYFLLT